MKLVAASLLLTGLVSSALGDSLYMDINLMQHFDHLANQRYPNQEYNEERLMVAGYIKEKFREYGLTVQEHRFNTIIRSDPLGLDEGTENVEGVNVIGILEGESKAPGSVLMLGASYDTNGVDKPLFMNGAGVAALLETARLYATNSVWSHKYKGNFTTIFVAFDLNTKHHMASVGKPGGEFFVSDWLWPFLGHNKSSFGGAIILDSIMNVNYKDNTQKADADFQDLFPEAYAIVEEDGKKGNFLGMVSVQDDKTRDLKDMISGSYNRERKRTPYKLLDMEVRRGIQYHQILQEFTKSESFHFWTFDDEDRNSAYLPAVLLTDTSNLRNSPEKPPSCLKVCVPRDYLTQERLEFVNATVKSLNYLLLKRQAYVMDDNAAPTTVASVLTVGLVAVLVRLYQ